MNKQQRKKRNQEWFSGEINKSDNPPKKSDKPITTLKREEGKKRERRQKKTQISRSEIKRRTSLLTLLTLNTL